MSAKTSYLGDGVYACFDGYQIELVTEHAAPMEEAPNSFQLRLLETHRIYLDEQTFKSLEAFARQCWPVK